MAFSIALSKQYEPTARKRCAGFLRAQRGIACKLSNAYEYVETELSCSSSPDE